MDETISGTNPASAFVGMFQDPTNRWFAFYLLVSFTIGCIVFLVEARHDPHLEEEGLFRYLFPKHIYTHRSAIADYWFFVINKLLFAAAFASLVAVSSYSADGVSAVLVAIAPSPGLAPPAFVATFTVTCAWALAMDFGLWLGHYWLHKVPILWEFHKVHHSAEVLTPATAGRVHPVEDALNLLVAGTFGGATLALCKWLFGPQVQVFNVLQLNGLIVVFYLFGFHLRHSHIWLPYKGIWGKLFVSPAHHQLHHSVAQRHWDKNMGFVFAIWDWMFGTLYAVDKREPIRIGMNGHEEPEYHSVRAMYLLPFVKAWRLIRGHKRGIEGLPHLPPAE
ncbi:Sterol desaturase/sphingolipid hydroxylase, fatty acid hydroxylase superfamily [Rhizobiales bacterium GAS188]|nr:Sterol desaturase/sphingolipid hydroxylase, fatty acid hydroxylase superfamily [Rhizobiales bacterium GAS188]